MSTEAKVGTHTARIMVNEQVYPTRGPKMYRVECSCGFKSEPSRRERDAEAAWDTHATAPERLFCVHGKGWNRYCEHCGDHEIGPFTEAELDVLALERDRARHVTAARAAIARATEPGESR